jgi:hypothetical protein
MPDYRWFAPPANIQHPSGIGFCGDEISNGVVTSFSGDDRKDKSSKAQISAAKPLFPARWRQRIRLFAKKNKKKLVNGFNIH